MIAYLVRLHQLLVFVARDPQADCGLPVECDVQLDDAKAAEPAGDTPVGLCVGIDPKDTHHYRVFNSLLDRAHAGFRQVVGIPIVVNDWDDFLQVARNCGEVLETEDASDDESDADIWSWVEAIER